MIHRLRQVTDGLYRGSAPTPKDVVWLHEKLGVRKIVSLDRETGEKIDRACKLLVINHVKLYLENHNDLAKIFQHNIKKLLLDGGPTFFHCHHGKDRTGLLAAMFECKYMGKDPEAAIAEAKALGFGVGVGSPTVRLYEKMIRSCKPAQDENNVDIVSIEREYTGDNRDTFLDESRQDSFSPYLDHTKQAPMDEPYNYIVEQSPTRQNYQNYKNQDAIKQYDTEGELTPADVIPGVGTYNNDSQVHGFGPTEQNGGFISD